MSAQMVPGQAQWGKHPVLSTFLWLFSSDTGSQSKSDNGASSSGTGKEWRDRTSNDLDMVFKPSQGARFKSKMGADMSAEIFNDGEVVEDDYYNSETPPYHPDDVGRSDNDGGKTGESPNWGFYVSLSPNHEQLYPKDSRDAAEQRSRTAAAAAAAISAASVSH